MSDYRFEPINKAHAIVETVLFFEFALGLGENIERLIPLRSELEGDFPSSDLLEVVEFNVTPQGTSPQAKTRPGGIELRRFKPDGRFEWLIRVTSVSISIHCLEYTRWKDVWDKINFYADKIFSKLAGTNVNVSGIGLKYVDQFVFLGDLINYDASLLFEKNTTLLHSKAFTSKAKWHCHSGWFEDADELGEVLSQMNIDSVTTMNTDGSEGATIAIDHTFTRRAQKEGDLSSYALPGKTGKEARSCLASWMHDANKAFLSDLLTDTIRKRISLYIDKEL